MSAKIKSSMLRSSMAPPVYGGFMDNRVEFDDARKIASAEGVELDPLWHDDGFV